MSTSRNCLQNDSFRVIGLCTTLVWIWIKCCESSLVDPLEDGVLITKNDELSIQMGEWTLLVTIDPPSVDPELAK